MDRIINSVLDTDLYKLSMMQAVWRQYPDAWVTYRFYCRNQIKLGYLAPQIREQVEMMHSLELSQPEAAYLRSLDFSDNRFVDWLSFNLPLVFGSLDIRDIHGDLHIDIEGCWLDVILWEVPLLSIINELYFKSISGSPDWSMSRQILENKKKNLKEYPGVKIAEFGTRRRYSRDWYFNHVGPALFDMSDGRNFIGTSNIQMAMKYNVKPIGTVAHEWTMAHLGLTYRPECAQKRALHVWQQEFGQRPGIALTDTFTTDAFLRDFDFPLARAYDGIRQDSGCPYEFTEKALKHYRDIGIDPRCKTIIYSDGLTISECIDLWKTFAGRVGIAFGVGTHITNDIFNSTPLNIVIKMTSCNDTPTVKLSDSPGKEMGYAAQVRNVKRAYHVNR